MKTLIEKINEKIDHFQENATSHVEKANKAAGMRARKASLELEKMLKEFRKKSLATQNGIPNFRYKINRSNCCRLPSLRSIH